MKKREEKIIDHKTLDLVIKELNENPQRKLVTAFALMSIIPILVFFYLLVSRFFTIEILVGDIGFIVFMTIFVALLGLFLGFGIIKNMLDRTIVYAAQARHSDQLKSTFVATVSHELKSPISIIRLNLFNMSQGLIGSVTEEQKTVIELCYDVTERMGSLVNDLLDLHKIEAGIATAQRKLCNLIDISEKQIAEFSNMFKEKGVKLVKNILCNRLPIWAEEVKIAQVFNNLLSNALKYTPTGGEVVLKVFSTDGLARLECIDTGPGIPTDKLEKIFDKFERLDMSKEGTGLGLAITKDIVQLHRGKIWAESILGQGSRFIVVLPRDLRQSKRS